MRPRNPDWEHAMRLLRPNWNSYGAKPITEEAIAAMRKLLEAKPHVVPLADGGLQLEWDQAEIVIQPNGLTEDDAALAEADQA
jgi:hypothetical protein